jgi:penicillin-binding protein 1A
VLWYWRDLPALDKATDYRPRQHLQVLTADGAEIAQFGSERRVFVPIARCPSCCRTPCWRWKTPLSTTTTASASGLVRATLANLTGGMPQGASTITQQVARTFFPEHAAHAGTQDQGSAAGAAAGRRSWARTRSWSST